MARSQGVQDFITEVNTAFKGNMLLSEDAITARKSAERSFGFHENHGKTI